MAQKHIPTPHLEIESYSDGTFRWSIYDGKGGPLLQKSEHAYDSEEVAGNVGARIAQNIETQAVLDDAEEAE